MAVRVAPEPLAPEPTSSSPAIVLARVSALERRLDDAVQSLPKHAEIEAKKQRKRNEEQLAMKALTEQVQSIQAARGGKRDTDLKAGELALIVKWVHLKRGMKGWSRISEHQARVNFLASIQGGWENLLSCLV